MARARGEHLPWVAYTMPGPGACTSCARPCAVRTAVLLPAPRAGCLRTLLCADCLLLSVAVAGLVTLQTLQGRGKLCPHCGRVWPRSPEAWHRNLRTRDGLEAWCKVCKSLDARARRRRRRWG